MGLQNRDTCRTMHVRRPMGLQVLSSLTLLATHSEPETEYGG